MSETSLPDGPYWVDGPWTHESGYPVTWAVRAPGWALCDCPREDVANAIAEALTASRAAPEMTAAERHAHPLLAGLLDAERMLRGGT